MKLYETIKKNLKESKEVINEAHEPFTVGYYNEMPKNKRPNKYGVDEKGDETSDTMSYEFNTPEERENYINDMKRYGWKDSNFQYYDIYDKKDLNESDFTDEYMVKVFADKAKDIVYFSEFFNTLDEAIDFAKNIAKSRPTGCIEILDPTKSSVATIVKDGYSTVSYYGNKDCINKLQESAESEELDKMITSYNKDINESEEYFLSPRFDSRQSFYNKARVVIDDDGWKTLISYSTPIVKVKDGEIQFLCDDWALSQTTLRHIKDFLRQMDADGEININSDDLTKKWIQNRLHKEMIPESEKPKHKKAVNINWDISEEDDEEDINSLPKEVNLPDNISLDEIADYLSDEYGYCVNSVDLLDESDAFDEYIIIDTGFTDDKTHDVLSAVEGQLSDGIWENSPVMEKYWRNMEILKDGKIKVNVGAFDSGFRRKSEEEIKSWLAHKIKQVIKEEGLKWDRNNTEHSDYLDYNSGVTVRDAYKVYDRLLGRKDYIQDSEKLKESEDSVLWSSEITEDNFDPDMIKEEYDDYVANFDGTIKPDDYEDWLDSDWLYNYLYNEWEHTDGYDEWSDFITNYPEKDLKRYYEEYLEDIKEREPDKPMNYDMYKEEYIENHFDSEWDFLQEDLAENINPMIDKQINNGILIISGNYHSNYPDFRKSGAGGVLLNKASDILDYFSKEDKVEFTWDSDSKQISVSAADHDGSIGGGLYTLPNDTKLLAEISRDLGFAEYTENEDPSDDELADYLLREIRYDNVEAKDLEKWHDKFIPITVDW